MTHRPYWVRASIAALLASLAVFLLGLYATEWVGHYGYSLFVGLPAVVGFLSVLYLCGPARQVLFRGVGLALIPLLGGALLFLLTGGEGFICLILAAPVFLVFAVIGTAVGFLVLDASRWITGRISALDGGGDKGPKARTTVLVLLPLFFALSMEPRLLSHPPTRMVQSSVVVNGDIESVWEAVVAFPEITTPPGGIFDYGIAYPIRATIEGTGVGAIRRCTFNTGDFVEPITVWEAPHHLAFDVVENPLPMREWGLWGDVDTPHLHGFMISERGEFRLTERADGTVLLQGNTWYRHDLWPNAYWGWVSDHIIHAIHGRVLGHIKYTVESAAKRPS